MMHGLKLSPRVLWATSAVAAAGYVALMRAVASGKTARWDRRTKRAVHAFRSSSPKARALTVASHSTTPLGKWWGYVPAALVTAAKLRREARYAAAWTIAGSSVAAALLPRLLDRLATRRLPPERHEPRKQSFPSGHALQTSAMAISTGYVLQREHRASTTWLPLAALSLATGLARLLLDRHWTSDVLAGYCAGISLGTASSGAYELARSQG